MRLSNLITSNETCRHIGPDPEILGVAQDSRAVRAGYLFVALPGTQADGRQFIDDAVARGAVAVLAPPATDVPAGIALIECGDIRPLIARLAARFYPDQPKVIAAVTGTSGKTSTAQFAREIWQHAGLASASIGTLGLVTRDEVRYGALTTPDAVTLHRLLEECAAMGIDHLALEASSHGLALHRLDHVHVGVACFTNLSRDHLDFHGTEEAYFDAKARLFRTILASGGTGVLPSDSRYFDALNAVARDRGFNVITFGKNAADLRLTGIDPDPEGQILNLEVFGAKRRVRFPVMGGFQALNGLAALGLVLGGGLDREVALAGLEAVTGVPGRLQFIGSSSGGKIFVDYAHKPDALENVLQTLRVYVEASAGGKLVVVFGCGGNRDKGKRPLMGEIACRLADRVFVTDDNPRHEDAATIRAEVIAGCSDVTRVREVGDRTEAIGEAIASLKNNDVLVIAGKGHESGQIIGDVTVPFDDAAIARTLLGSGPRSAPPL